MTPEERELLPEHSNILCMTRIERVLRRWLAKVHDPHCNCQMEPWNRLTREEIRSARRLKP